MQKSVDRGRSTPADARPFGTETPRSRSPLVLWGVLWAAWFVFLIVLAWREGLLR